VSGVSAVRFYLSIPADHYLDYYAGAARYVQVSSYDGRRVRFSAHLLQPFVGHDGVHGEFLLRFDENNKFVSLEKVGA
jgi:hypothetical protein